MGLYIVQFLLITLLCLQVNSLRFFLAPNTKKCLKDEVHKGTVVIGEYEFGDSAGQKASIHITDVRGHTLFKREDFTELTGKFAYTADQRDTYDICLINKVPQGTRGSHREVNLNMKHGVEAKNYDELGKAEKLKPLEVELRRLEDLSENIVQDFAYMRQREEEMRNTNESTNLRVLSLSIFSMVCLLGLATWQVLYLRRYFKAKKLID